MSNYFMNQFMQGGTDNFLRQQLIPYLQRRFNQQQGQEFQNDSQNTFTPQRQLSDASTQTAADLPWRLDSKLNFDPIQLFYNTLNTKPSASESINRVRAEEQARHQQHMQETLYNLNKQHKDTLESVNKCLNAERTARQIEKSALQTQIQALNDKIALLQNQKTCVVCGQEFGVQCEKYNNELAELQQTNLDKQYRIQELEQQFSSLLNDYRGIQEQYQIVMARSVQAEEQLKLYQTLLRKLQMLNTDIFNGNNTNPAISNVFGIMTELLGNIGGTQSQSSSGSSISQSDVELQRRKQQEEFNKFQTFANTFEAAAQRQYDRINENNKLPSYFAFYNQQQQQQQSQLPTQVEFTKDTTPPAAPHVQFPPQLVQMYQEQQNESKKLNIVTDTKTPQAPVSISGNGDLVMSQELKNKLLYSQQPDPDKENPDKPDRNAICVRNSNIQQIQALDSFNSSQGTSPDAVNGNQANLVNQKNKNPSVIQNTQENSQIPPKKSPGRPKTSIQQKVDESMSNDFDDESKRTIDDDFDTQMSTSASPQGQMQRLSSVARFDEMGKEIPVDKNVIPPSKPQQAKQQANKIYQQTPQPKVTIQDAPKIMNGPGNQAGSQNTIQQSTNKPTINQQNDKPKQTKESTQPKQAKLSGQIRGYEIKYDNSAISTEEKEGTKNSDLHFSQNIFGNTDAHQSGFFDDQPEKHSGSLQNSFTKVFDEGIKDESFQW